MSPSQNEIISEVITDLLHPEFGSIYREPDGEAYLAYQAGLTEGRAESTRKKTRMKSEVCDKDEYQDAPAHPDGLTALARSANVEYTPTPMSKTEAGIIGVVVIGVLTGFGFMIRADIKMQEEREAEYKTKQEERDRKAEATRKARAEWFDTQRKNGMRILETRDGRYVAISNEAYTKAEIKKKGEWL